MKRIYHTWEKWECYPAGFYSPRPPEKMTDKDLQLAYAAFLADIPRFSSALVRVLTEWPRSCEHYLTNENMNRIAWLGQASACIDSGYPRIGRGGYNLLNDEQKAAADTAALECLNRWLVAHNETTIADLSGAASKTQMDLY